MLLASSRLAGYSRLNLGDIYMVKNLLKDDITAGQRAYRSLKQLIKDSPSGERTCESLDDEFQERRLRICF